MMKHLQEEDNGLSIADRTISLRYHQFRTPRRESRQLILNNKKTYLLSEAEKQKYLIWNSEKNLYENISNIKEEINIDIEGFSIEIAKSFGNNYLGNNCILVSSRQIDCDSIIYNSSNIKNKIIRKIFDIHRNTIEQILMGEPLIGTIRQKNIDMMIDNPESLSNIEIVFDTPNNAISKLKNIRENERILLETDGKLKDRLFLKNLLQNIDDVSTKHGSLDRIPDKEINLKEKVDFNKLHLNDIDIYCLKSADGTNIFVYFIDDSNFDDKEHYMNDDIIILNGKDLESLNVLMELGMVGYNPYLGLERAANMIIRNRKEKKENKENIETEQNNRFFLDTDENMPEVAKELLTAVESLIENKRDKDFFVNLGQIKTYMIYPLIQNEILYDLLTRMENDKFKSYYMNTEKFIQFVSNMNDDQLREFIENILDSLEFIEENNTMVNMWLNENRKNVCNDLGIKFISR